MLIPGKDYHFVLADAGNAENPPLKARIRLSENDSLLMIGVEGFGECTALDGEGFPIIIEHYHGKLRVLAWGNINSEEPTATIDMSGALDKNRSES